MISHMVLIVSDIDRSRSFYEAALRPLGFEYMPAGEQSGMPFPGFSDGQEARFFLQQGTPNPQTAEWGFSASSKEHVDRFYKAALAAGGSEIAPPQSRLGFNSGYVAQVTDPDGYRFEVIERIYLPRS